MPTTYNNNLRLAIIANGEQTGTWGTTTNANLGTVLVDAITGLVSITTNVQQYPLLAANGAADEARSAMLVLDTTYAGTYEVYAPPVSKLYIIRNASGQTLNLYNATLANGIIPAGVAYVVPPGKTVFVQSNGVQFTDAVNRINGALTLGSALPVSSGGTGQTSYTDGQLLIGNSTGNTLSKTTLTAGSNITITNGPGTITIAASGGGASVTSVTATAPVASSGGSTPDISLQAGYGDTLNPYASKATNLVLASPNGSSGVPSFRALVGADLPTVGTITPSTYGSASQVAQITVDSKGRITGITNVAISGGGAVSSVTGSGAITASPTTGSVVVSVANASSSSAGILTTGSQNIAGAKTFDSSLTANGFLTNSLAYNWTATTAVFYNANGYNFDYSGSRILNVYTSGTDPGADNSRTLGTAGNRWSVVFAANGTINTSDANEKQDIADLDEAEKRVAVRIKGLIKKFRFKDAVIAKGDAARIHVGVIAQEVRDAFTAEGLDADRYGLFCSDTWWEREEMVERKHLDAPRLERVIYTVPTEGATEKTRLGVRYEQLLAFVIAAM